MRYAQIKSFVRNTSRQQAIGFSLLVILLLLNAALSYIANVDLIRKESNIQRTLNFLVALKDTFSALQDAESGKRGYLLSGNELHLEPYQVALTNMDAHITILLSLQSQLPAQQADIDTLIGLISQTRDEMEQVVNLSHPETTQDPYMVGQMDRGHALMSQVRDLVQSMETREYNRISAQRYDAMRSRRQVVFAIALATFTGLLLVGAVYILIQRATRRQQMDAEKLALTNEELEAIIKDRTLAIERYSQELQRSNRELQDFAFVASHDLQEPLRKIRAFGDRLNAILGDDQQNEQVVDYVRRMQAAADRMSLLIYDLLEFSRVSTRPSQFETISLQSALDDVLDTLSEFISAKGALIKADPLPSIDADPTQMRQLLQNLLANALKFTAPTVQPRIRIRAETFTPQGESDSGMWCRIKVSDNGVGFDPRFAGRIFTPFQRLHGRQEYSGSGIGLAVCRRVVERHGGAISATSKPGSGSVFTVELPRFQAYGMTITEEGLTRTSGYDHESIAATSHAGTAGL